MKINNLLIGISCAILLATSCKKDDNTSTTANATVDANGNIIMPTNINGALYAVNTTQSGPGFPSLTTQSTFAWFNSAIKSDSAGAVKCANSSLYQFMVGTWYQGSGTWLFNIDSNNLVWNVQGNTTKGIPAFTYTHSEPFPKTFTYNVNSTAGIVSLNNSLTITNSSLPSNISAIIYGLKGDKGQKNVGVNGTTSTSYTFSSADLKSVAVTGSQIAITAMPVILTPATISGKTFYFVKQFQVNQIYNTQ